MIEIEEMVVMDDVSDTSTCSGVSSRSCQSDLDRVDSRAENVTSGASNKR